MKGRALPVEKYNFQKLLCIIVARFREVKMKYESVLTIARREAMEKLHSQDEADVRDALLRLTYHNTDREWVEVECIRLIEDMYTSDATKQLAITCIGHLARIHRTLNKTTVMPVLARAAETPVFSGYVDNTMDDIYLFISDETHN
ncbi:MAG: hypothetical protein AAF787_11150 [Chloroflexota bacterium]